MQRGFRQVLLARVRRSRLEGLAGMPAYERALVLHERAA